MTRNELAELLPKLGLVTQGELLDITAAMQPAKREKVEDLLAQLCRVRKLTHFQAQMLFRGNGKALILGPYVFQEKLGTGGFGTVFRAKHRLMDRPVAIKVLHEKKLDARDYVDRFQREVRAAARLEHPNIVKAYDAGQSNGMHYLVMELVEGKVLQEVLKEKGRFTVESVVNYIRQAAEGLDYAHRQGVIHRDIKPSNLMLDSEGRIKILDMGLARLNAPQDAGASQMTQVGTSLGTSDFMAPEQAVDCLQADARSDIYSLGCTLYYLLVGEVVFPNRSELKRIVDHQVASPPSLRMTRPDAPAELDHIFRLMISKHPDERYQSMADVANELKILCGAEARVEATAFGPSSLNVRPSALHPSAFHQSPLHPSAFHHPSAIRQSQVNSSRAGVPPTNMDTRNSTSGLFPTSYSNIGRQSEISYPSSIPEATYDVFIPTSEAWYEPLLRHENRAYFAGGVAGLMFAIIAGSMFLTGPADPKVPVNRNFSTYMPPSLPVVAPTNPPNVVSSPYPVTSPGNVAPTNTEVAANVVAPIVAVPKTIEGEKSLIAPQRPPQTPVTDYTRPPAAMIQSTPVVSYPTQPSNGQGIALHYSFDNAANGVTTLDGESMTAVRGSRQYTHIMYFMQRDTTAPMKLTMRESAGADGMDKRPGVLQLIADTIPDGSELVLFKLGGQRLDPYFHLQQWKPMSVTLRNLRQTRVQMNHRLVRANPADETPMTVGFSLEQNHPSNYEARLDLDMVKVTTEWQTYAKRLSSGENIEKFLAAMAENPDAGLQLVWSAYRQPFRTGDRIEIDEIKFFHEENATSVSSTK